MNALVRIFLQTILIALSIISFANDTDTVDVWKVKLNGKTLINSNEVEIYYSHPMMVNITNYKADDVLEIWYGTDNGSEHREWNFIFRDSINDQIATFTNELDSTTLQHKYVRRKNHIPFKVENLKKLLIEKDLKKLFVYFEFDKNRYYKKPVCIFSIE